MHDKLKIKNKLKGGLIMKTLEDHIVAYKQIYPTRPQEDLK
jgi:hypothetical protein